MTLAQIDVLATIFCYDVTIDGDSMTATVSLDGAVLYAVALA